MIHGAHMIINSQDADADRAFFRDVLGLPNVDAGNGWLLFALPPAELALHPAAEPSHQLYFMCDDLPSTMERLAAAGVEFTAPVTEQRWGLITALRLPSGAEVSLYEPRHPIAAGLTQNPG